MHKTPTRLLASMMLIVSVSACESSGGGSGGTAQTASAAQSSSVTGTVVRDPGVSTSTTQSTPVSEGYSKAAPTSPTIPPAKAGSPAKAVGGGNPTTGTGSAAGNPTGGGSGTTGGASGGGTGGTTTPPPSVVKKSISAWVSCSGTTDDEPGVAAAFAAAKQAAFTLVVDCPVKIHSGVDIARSIFIDNGVTVEFTGAGKFFVDNLFHPAFVIANSSNIVLSNWNVEWDGNVPVSGNLGGYELNGTFVAMPGGHLQPAGAFNDQIITPWLTKNRGVIFDESQGWITAIWFGGVNTGAVFFITGDTSNVVFSGLNLYVPKTVGVDHFIPVAVSLSPNWKSNQTVTGRTAQVVRYAAVPHGLSFSNITFDGTYMGWQGNARDVMFENIQSFRYGDLQDANGGNVGGVGKWFPPPHLFYLNYVYAGDPGLFNTNIHISNVTDSGPRLGTARDKGGSDTASGYAESLKLGCTDCSVDQYTTTRPDGLMDVLPSDGLTISNVTATWDSAFLNNLYPGLRFPAEGLSHITLENIQMTDLAAVSTHPPIGNAGYQSNVNIVFTNVQIGMTRWGGSDYPVPKVAGTNNNVVIGFAMSGDPAKGSANIRSPATAILQASPSTLSAGSTTILKWSVVDGSNCTASGPWSGGLGSNGSRVVKLAAAGQYNFTLTCQNSNGTSSAVVPVTVK